MNSKIGELKQPLRKTEATCQIAFLQKFTP